MELGPDPEKASDTISVDQVRELLRTLSLHRHSAKCRFVIVDPAHQMNASATNALLKTLEEPPEHSGFILVSDRAGMLLPTVLSRSLRVRFNAVPHVELTAWLEGRGVAEADRVARLAFGSPGLALELAAGRHEALAKASEELLDGIAAGPKALFDYVEALTSSARSGADERVERVLEVLEVLLRDAVQQASGRPDALVEPVASATTARWARAMWPGGIARMERALATARARLHVNVSARVVMEALLAELCLELGEAARGGAS
jgi:DNA polymerase-3 subunit delta'